MSDIYQDLWDADAAENGCSVSGLRADGQGWANENADVLLDIQVAASGKRGRDLATRPLFAHVNEEKLGRPVYRTFIDLLDNYVASAREAEEETPEERREIDDVLDAVMETRVAAVALEYLKDHLGEVLTPKTFRASLNRLWFELFTNYFGGKATEYASGFEHVFVGEGKYDSRSGREPHLGEVSGYHSWVKFYLDEKLERVNFLGYKFDLRGGIVPKTPDVVTLQMLWNLVDMRGRVVAQLFKKKGGFFVGPSPAYELVVGAVAVYESRHGLLVQDKRRTVIHDGELDLVLYPSTTPQGTRGDFIRSLYPVFLGPAQGGVRDPPAGAPGVVRIGPNGYQRGDVIITAALPNPEGDDAGKEWVELLNRSSAAISLAGWELRDRIGRPLTLSGAIDPGETVRVTVPPGGGQTFSLGKKGGFISLHDLEGVVAGVNYDKAGPGEVVTFPAS